MKKIGLMALMAFALTLRVHGAQVALNLGNTNNDAQGDGLRTTFLKIQTNLTTLFDGVYTNQVGGGGGSASNAVTKINELTNALQYFQIRTNAASVPTVNTNGAGSKATNFFDFPYASTAVSGIINSNDWQKIPPLQNANRGYVEHTNTGNYSVISGGATNRIESPWSAIGGGQNNRILSTGTGTSNDVAAIFAGEDNIIEAGNVKHSFIGAGQSNRVHGGAVADVWAGRGARYGNINGGWLCSIAESNTTTGGGWKNSNHVYNSTIAGGYSNYIAGAEVDAGFGNPYFPQANVIGGGGQNFIRGSYGVIAGGLLNQISTNGTGTLEGNFIGGGLQNHASSAYSVIAGGTINHAAGGGILAGTENYSADNCGVVSGFRNKAQGLAGFIGAGWNNTINAEFSSIVGGQNSTISADNVHIIGSDLTGNVANTVNVGTDDATKFTVDATAATARGTLIVTGGANITGGITNAALTASRPVKTDANKRLTSALIDVTSTSDVLVPAITNVYTSSTAFTSITNGIQNSRANFKTVSVSGSVTLTDNGTNLVFGSSAGGGNVVGPPSSTALTLAPYTDTSGALLTNSFIATDSARTNLFVPGVIRDYRSISTNGLESLGWAHVSGHQTNDGTIYTSALDVNAVAVFHDGIQVSLDSSFLQDIAITDDLTVGDTASIVGNLYAASMTATNGMTNFGPYIGTGTNDGRIRLTGTNTGFIEFKAPTSGSSNSVIPQFVGVAAGDVLGIVHSVTVQAGTNSIVQTNVTTTGSGSIVRANGPSLGTFGSSTNANLNFVYITNNNAFLLTTQLVATNSTVNSNLTMNVNVGVLDLIITNNISVTNFSNLEAGTSKTVTWHIYPTLVNRTVVWPTLGAAGYGVRWYTNANAPMWTTLTQGVAYALSMEWRNTNCFPSISEWK